MKNELLLERLRAVQAWTRKPSTVVSEESAGGRWYYRQALDRIDVLVKSLVEDLEKEAVKDGRVGTCGVR